MRNLIIVLLFCGIHVLNAIVCNNPLKSRFNFTGPANSANVSGITVCKSLQNKESCCDLDTFNNIQTKTNTLLQTLRDVVAARDVEITNVRLKILPGLSGALNRINNVMVKSANGSIANFSFANVFTGYVSYLQVALSGNSAATALLSSLTIDADTTATMNTALFGLQSVASKMPNLKDNFIAYQKNRTKCILSLVKFQAAAWCLACDPDYTTKGVDNSGNVNLSTTMKDRLQNACYDYFAGTEEQSKLLELQGEKDIVDGMANVMEKLQNFDMNAGADFQTLSTNMAKITNPSEKYKKPAKKPGNCTRGNCTFVYDTVVKNLQINTDLLGNGGTFDDGTTASRLLEEDFAGRVLQTGNEWTADEDEANVQVTFSDDPGNANTMTAGASFIKGALTAFAIVLLTLLF